MSFYGCEKVSNIKVTGDRYRGINNPIDLYKALGKIWCADTCPERMRAQWTCDNKTLGQCSITAFLAQDIFGGEVFGMRTSDNYDEAGNYLGGYHCYNKVGDVVFDLTSEQYGEKASELVYDCMYIQERDCAYHFGKEEKRQRYEYLKSRLIPEVSHHVYFVRHGQTVWNVENKICGATDSPLTDKGREQAKAIGQEVKNQGIKVDEILYSPLSRARDTAMEIAKAINVPSRMEVRLIEQDFGKWEGTARNGVDFLAAKREFVTDNEGGESMLRLCQRIYNLLDELRAQPDKVYLLVAHNGIARAVNSYFNNMSNEEYASFGIGNCEIRKFDF